MSEERIGQQRWLALDAVALAKLDAVLNEFLSVSGAKCALLVDKDGYLVTQQGKAFSFDNDTISALVAGGYGATKEIARLLGEDEFSVLYHQGKRESLQLTLVADCALLSVIFDNKTTLGLIRLYSQEAAKALAGVIVEMNTNSRTMSSLEIDTEYASNARERLDNLFG